MNLLRDELHAMADEAPHVDLAERAVKGARRRRFIRAALAVAVAVAVVTGGTAILVGNGPSVEEPVIVTPATKAVTALPKKGVGPLTHAYVSQCPRLISGGKKCVAGQWRVVTDAGTTYALVDAMGFEPGSPPNVPVAITKDGRRIAYYSAKARAFEVRDLASGQIWKAPFKIEKENLKGETFLRLSPDGLQLIYTNWDGTPKRYSVLIDMEKGMTFALDAAWYPVSVGDGGSPITLAKPYDKTSQVWVVGNKPITIRDFTYKFSALGPDERTLVRLGRYPGEHSREITAFDAVSGAERPPVRVEGIPDKVHLISLGDWVGDTEVTLFATPEPSTPGAVPALYAVDVRTGRARELRRFDDSPTVLPGMIR